MALKNIIGQKTTTTGAIGVAATVSLDGAALSGLNTFAAGGAVSGEIYTVGIKEGSDRQVGRATYTSGTPDTLTIDSILASTNGGAAITLTGDAEVYIDAAAEDLGSFVPATLTHTTGTISVDLAAADYFEFVADTYAAGGTPTVVASSGFTLAGSNTTLTIPGTPQEDDVVLVIMSGIGGSPSLSSAAGWTELATSNFYLTLKAYYKVMGATPDTTVDVDGANDEVAGIYLIRGQKVGDPINITSARDGNGSGMPDPPSITTTVNETLVVAFAGLKQYDLAGSGAAPSGYGNLISQAPSNPYPSAGNVHLLAATKDHATAGAENPGAFGGSGSDEWDAYTTAFQGPTPTGEADYTVNLSNIPAAGSLIKPKILMLETKTDVGIWTFNNIDQWVGGAAPAMDTIGLHAIRLWSGNGQVTAEYLGGP